MRLDLWLQLVVVDQGIFIHSIFKLALRVDDGHNHVCNTVATFPHARLLFARIVCLRTSKRARKTCGDFPPWASERMASLGFRRIGRGGFVLRRKLNVVWFVNRCYCVLHANLTGCKNLSQSF